MKRKEYSLEILKKCIELLKSNHPVDILEGVICSAYIIEQSLKFELNNINCLLTVDRKNISELSMIKFVLKKNNDEERFRMKTINARECIAQICECESNMKKHRANLEELFRMRNYIIHSLEESLPDEISMANIAVSALENCKKYILKWLKIKPYEFNPITSKEFEKLEKTRRKEKINNLKAILNEHRVSIAELSEEDAERRYEKNIPDIDSQSWWEATEICPACNFDSLDKIGCVDFDAGPDGVLTSAGFYYLCRICRLYLDEYDYNLSQNID